MNSGKFHEARNQTIRLEGEDSDSDQFYISAGRYINLKNPTSFT